MLDSTSWSYKNVDTWDMLRLLRTNLYHLHSSCGRHATNFQLLKESVYKLLVTAFWGVFQFGVLEDRLKGKLVHIPLKQSDVFAGLEIAMVSQRELCKIQSKSCQANAPPLMPEVHKMYLCRTIS